MGGSSHLTEVPKSKTVDHYDRCYACYGHVFKPKRLTKEQYEKRLGCLCMCHWGEDYSLGITHEEARRLVN